MSSWLEILREACKPPSSQAATAKRIGYAASVVNAVLQGKYKGDLKAVQKAVEGALMGATVDCPVVGDISRKLCLEHQRAPFAATNPARVQFFRTCPTCPNNLAVAKAAGGNS